MNIWDLTKKHIKKGKTVGCPAHTLTEQEKKHNILFKRKLRI